jgi:hypothetical protein
VKTHLVGFILTIKGLEVSKGVYNIAFLSVA